MNFYARQAQARRHTRRLVVLFLLAVIAVLVAINFVVLSLLATVEAEGPRVSDGPWLATHPGTILFTSIVVLAVIGLSSLYKSSSLRDGGGVVARALGGTRLDRSFDNPLRRRLFNVVEEMAIASGVPMPEVYVLEQEAGINAFAAGHSPANAAVAVTRGALEKLNRAELQGVIAHEFSHVLNGDMRLNTRLIGLLFGLLVVAVIGRTVLRHAPRSSGRKGGAGLIVLAALAVMIMGYVGVFFGRMIQAAVSRQRERLADASAVQFTREPQGLKGALLKIGGYERGSKLDDPKVDEVAHMLFASGMTRLFATHPPLEERIRALDPSFNPSEFTRVTFDTGLAPDMGREQLTSEAVSDLEGRSGALASATVAVTPTEVARLVGNPGTPEVREAQRVARSLPREIISTLDSAGHALGALLALTLDPHADLRERQLAIIHERLGDAALGTTGAAEAAVGALTPEQRLPVLGEVFPLLRRLPRAERQRILDALQRLILIDGRIAIFEYGLATLARMYLHDELQPLGSAATLTLAQATAELQTVLSTLAQHGSKDEIDARRAYELGMHHLLPATRPEYRPVAGWPRALDRALKCLDRLRPAGKEQLIEALVKTIAQDGRMALEEAELLRTICAALHCPLPPLLASSAPIRGGP
jgi:Zn-dependent protease with chaperone function